MKIGSIYILDNKYSYGGTMKKHLSILKLVGIWLFLIGTKSFATGEFMLDTTLRYVSAFGDHSNPAIAFDGTNYFVVWEDNRICKDIDGPWRIYGTRIKPDGTVLDPAGGILISTKGYSQNFPAIAFDGTNYMVVWGNYDGTHSIIGARVTTSGIALDTQGIVISAGSIDSSLYNPSIAFDGTNYMVVWENRWYVSPDYFAKTQGVRVSPSGIVLDAKPFTVSNTTIANSFAQYPSIVFGKTNYLVVWENYLAGHIDLYGTRVSTNGSILDSVSIAVCTLKNEQSNPKIAFDGNNYFVIFRDYCIKGVVGGGYDSMKIYGVRVDTSGTVLDTQGIFIHDTPQMAGYEFYIRIPSVTFGNNQYFVAWEEVKKDTINDINFDNVYGIRIDKGGKILDTVTIFNDSKYYDISTATSFGKDNYFIVCGGIGSRVDSTGAVLDSPSINIITTVNEQYEPVIASNGTDYLVVWKEWRGVNDYSSVLAPARYDLYATRINLLGDILDSKPILIVSQKPDFGRISVASCVSNYLVVWSDTSGILRATRISPSGTIIDTELIITQRGWDPFVIFDGTNYFVSWLTATGSEGTYFIYGTRVDTNGNILPPGEFLVATSGWPFVPINHFTGFDGTNYLINWIGANYVGTLVDTSGIVLNNFLMPGNGPLIFGNSEYFVLKNGKYGPEDTLFGFTMDSTGIVSGSNILTTTFGYNSNIGKTGGKEVVFDGTNYLVIFGDKQNGKIDIYGALIDTTCTIVDTFAISTAPKDKLDVKVAKGQNNQSLIVYSGYASFPYNGMRIWAKFYPFPGVEEQNDKSLMLSAKLEVGKNPFGKTAVIKYQLPVKSKVSLKIYNISGQTVKTLVNEEKESGSYNVILDTKDLVTGVYFVKLTVPNYTETKKLILVR